MISELNPRSSFESYVIGRANGLAAAAARAVAETPGSVYNPLCITGDRGLGKTHLLMAIASFVEQGSNRLVVEYFTPDGLAEQFHAANSAGQSEAFRHRLSETDVLLIDDMQSLAHQSDVQAELIRVTADMHAAGKQIAFSAQCHPAEISGVDKNFLAWVGEGLVVNVGAPEYETRLSILQARSEERGSSFEQGVLETVASYDTHNVRELIAALNRLVALQAVSETPLTAEAARALFEGEVHHDDVAAAPSKDEFADFLSGVSNRVKLQVDAWESKLNEVIKRWADQGYCTDRLEGLTERSESTPVEMAIREFERDVDELRQLKDSASETDPSLATDPVFFDPDRIAEARDIADKASSKSARLPGPSPIWVFDGYIGSWANAEAIEAAKAVAGYPGVEHNPLVIVGPTGVGKTHLLHATGNAMVAATGAQVACLSAQDLGKSLAHAEASGTVDEWRSQLAEIKALLVDDLHTIVDNGHLQWEVLSFLQRIGDLSCQFVCTLDREPSQVRGMDKAIADHLDAGFAVTLSAPDRELRLGMVNSLLRQSVGSVDPALADYLADRSAESMRAVTAAVARVINAAEARDETPTAALARELIEGSERESKDPEQLVRTSGVVGTPASSVRSREKMIWVWPDPGERLIEDLS